MLIALRRPTRLHLHRGRDGGGPTPAGAVPANTLYAALSWRDRPEHYSATLELLGRSRIPVDDANSDAAAGYGLVILHGELRQQRHAWQFTESLRIDNFGDRPYVGSVIVNESNSRYCEPEPGCSAFFMFSATHF